MRTASQLRKTARGDAEYCHVKPIQAQRPTAPFRSLRKNGHMNSLAFLTQLFCRFLLLCVCHCFVCGSLPLAPRPSLKGKLHVRGPKSAGAPGVCVYVSCYQPNDRPHAWDGHHEAIIVWGAGDRASGLSVAVWASAPSRGRALRQRATPHRRPLRLALCNLLATSP
jgi:hypothetical protein